MTHGTERPSRCHRGRLLGCGTALTLAAMIPTEMHAALLDFETLPDGTPTVDTQEISDQYAA